jgi:IclR family transcriptional regulator, KDG regulon repressor
VRKARLLLEHPAGYSAAVVETLADATEEPDGAAPAVDGTGPSRDSVRAVERAHALLEVLSHEQTGLGLTEIARRAGLGFSTCHRLLRTLAGLGYVVQDPETGHYLLGYKVLELATRVQSLHLLLVLARPIMVETMRASGETTNLAVRDGEHGRYVAQVPSRASVRMFVELGSPAPLHASAGGKVLLANAPESIFEAVVGEGLPARTSRTLTAPESLRASLDEIRTNGFGFDNGEFEDGLMCVAAPVRNHTGSVVAALSVAGPSGRVVPNRDALIELVVANAGALSTALGCPSPARQPGDGASRVRSLAVSS